MAQWLSVGGGVNSQVRSFRVDTANNRLLVGGAFPYVQGGTLRANNIAWWDGEGWDTLGLANGNGDPTPNGQQTDPAFSVAMRGDTIFVGHLGSFWQLDSALGYATMLVNNEWLPCAEPNGIFYFLESNGRMFSGGVHDSLYHAYAPGIHEWRNGAFQDIPNMPFTEQVQVNDVDLWQGQYYFGGVFSAFDSPRMVAFDGVDQWSPLSGGVGGHFISTICGYGDSLYVGGFLQAGPNVQSTHVQLWDGTEWKPFFPQVEFIGVVRDIQVYDGALYVAGIYNWVGETTQYGLLRYDGHQLCTIGGPMPTGDNGNMAFFQNSLYLAVGAPFPPMPDQRVVRLPLDGLVPDRCVEVGPNSIAGATTVSHTLAIHPNPSYTAIEIQLPNGSFIAQAAVIDAVGRHVKSLVFSPTEKLVIDIQDLQPGTYTVQCEAQGRHYLGRFVKE